MAPAEKKYDLLLCGVTGFTGKLAAEHLLTKKYAVRWAVCARSEAKAKSVLEELRARLGLAADQLPPLELADLLCSSPEEEATLRALVRATRVVLTTAGPFEKYGQALIRLCAEEGAHYADITGETDFVRQSVAQLDAACQRSGAVLVSHCGNDCIPWEVPVFEMHQHARARGGALVKASTFCEFPPGTAASGGTLATAIYQLGKQRGGVKDGFDPLLRARDGSKSQFVTKVVSPKKPEYYPELKRYGGPWIMAPVMANCVRRSNALLGYSEGFTYSEAELQNPSWWGWVKDQAYRVRVGAAIYLPGVFKRFLPQPGEGPTRATMEAGWLEVTGHGTMRDGSGQEKQLRSSFRFNEDVTYLCTARLLVECGMLLLEGGRPGGVLTPAAAFGSSLRKRITEHLDATFQISES